MEDYTIISVIPGNPLPRFVPVISEEVNLGSQPIQSLCFLQSALKTTISVAFTAVNPKTRNSEGRRKPRKQMRDKPQSSQSLRRNPCVLWKSLIVESYLQSLHSLRLAGKLQCTPLSKSPASDREMASQGLWAQAYWFQVWSQPHISFLGSEEEINTFLCWSLGFKMLSRKEVKKETEGEKRRKERIH